MYCSSSPVPSVATTSACVSPRVNSAEPWARGRTPTSATIGRTVFTSRPSMRAPVSRMFQRTTLAWASLKTLLTFSASNFGLAFRGHELGHDLRLDGVDGAVALLLDGLPVGLAQVRLGDLEHRLLDLRGVGRLEVARLLRGLLGEADDRLDHRLEMLVAEHHGAEHHVLGELLRLRLDHQHGVLRAGDDEVERGVLHLRDRRVELVPAVDVADARGADRAHEGHAGERQRRGGRDDRHDVGIVLEVVREHGDDDLGVVLVALDEQRADRAVDEARDQRLLLGRAAFALEVAAGDAAGGVGALLVVDGEREEVEAGLRLLVARRRSRARWSRRRSRPRRRRPGGPSCRSRARACARPRSALRVGYRTFL